MFKKALVLFISLTLLPAAALAGNGTIMFGGGYFSRGYYPQTNYGMFCNPGYISNVSFAGYSQTTNMSNYSNYGHSATQYAQTNNWGFSQTQYLQVNHGVTYSSYISSNSYISPNFGTAIGFGRYY